MIKARILDEVTGQAFSDKFETEEEAQEFATNHGLLILKTEPVYETE